MWHRIENCSGQDESSRKKFGVLKSVICRAKGLTASSTFYVNYGTSHLAESDSITTV